MQNFLRGLISSLNTQLGKTEHVWSGGKLLTHGFVTGLWS